MVILASASPRRKLLLSKILPSFEIKEASIDEHETFLKPHELPLDLAKQKAYHIFKSHTNDLVIACDTVVVFNDEIYGKPKNYEDGKTMLKNLSGNSHIVLTGYCIICKYGEFSGVEKTIVTFNSLTDQEIENYLKTNSYLDKAGGYGIQDKQHHLVKRIDGSENNVIGFPLEKISLLLNKISVSHPELFH